MAAEEQAVEILNSIKLAGSAAEQVNSQLKLCIFHTCIIYLFIFIAKTHKSILLAGPIAQESSGSRSQARSFPDTHLYP
jgi:hypothetical protein